MINEQEKTTLPSETDQAENKPVKRRDKRATADPTPVKKTDAARRRAVKYPRRKKKKKQWWTVPLTVAACCVIVAALVVGVTALAQFANFQRMRGAVDRDTFYPGVTIGGEDMSVYTLEAAQTAFAERDAVDETAHNVTIDIEGKTWTLDAEALGYDSDYRQVLVTAYAIGRYGTLAQRYGQVANLAGVWSRDFTVNNHFSDEALEAAIDEIATASSEPGVLAQVTGFDPDSKAFTFEEGKDGYIVDPHELYDQVQAQIAQGGGTLSFARTKVDHGESVESLQSKFGMVSSALTEGHGSSDNRLNNLRVACKTINGVCVQPGQVYSMNATLGRRTRAKGYKAAGALENGVHTTQIGGGICQVTTTLFNAVGRADLEIVERYPHSIPSDYIALGRDATVNWPNQDFKFRNNTDYAIYIAAGMNKKQQVIVQIYGKMRDDGIVVKLEGVKNQTYSPKETTYVYTKDLPTGQKRTVEEKRKGYLATTYRVYYNAAGKEIKRVELFKSYYAPAGAVVEIGK